MLAQAPATDLAHAAARGLRHHAAAVAGVRGLRLHLRPRLGTTPCRCWRRRNELLAVRLFDPLELELPDLGLLMMQDAETGEQMWVDTHDQGFRKPLRARRAEQREAELRDGLHAGPGSTLWSCPPTTTSATPILALRRTQARSAAGHRRRGRRLQQESRHEEAHAMTFMWMAMLWLLLLVPLMVAGYLYMPEAAQEGGPSATPTCRWSSRRWARGWASAATCRRSCSWPR